MGLAEARTSASTRTESWMVPRKTAIRSRRFASIDREGLPQALAEAERDASADRPARERRAGLGVASRRAARTRRRSARAGRGPRSRGHSRDRRSRPARGRGSRAGRPRPRACRPARGRPTGTSRAMSRSTRARRSSRTLSTGIGGRSTGGKARRVDAITNGSAAEARSARDRASRASTSTSVVARRSDRPPPPAGVSSRCRSTTSSERPRAGLLRDHQLVQRRGEVALALGRRARRSAGRPRPRGRRRRRGGGRSTGARRPTRTRYSSVDLRPMPGAPALLEVEEEHEDRLQVALVLAHHRRAAPRGGRPVDAPHVVARPRSRARRGRGGSGRPRPR